MTKIETSGSVLRVTISPAVPHDVARDEVARALAGMPGASAQSGVGIVNRDGSTVAEVVCTGLPATSPVEDVPLSAVLSDVTTKLSAPRRRSE